MNTLETAYKILNALENGKPTEYAMQRIGPDALGAEPSKWLDVMKALDRDGYIAGAVFGANVLGETTVDCSGIYITLAGAQYLKENSVMAKIAKLASNVITIMKP